MKFNKTEATWVQIKGMLNLKGTCPSFFIDAICSTSLKNNFVLDGMLLIYEVGLPPKPLSYCRLNHKNRLILKSTWKKTTKAHSITLIAVPGPVLISRWQHCGLESCCVHFTATQTCTIYSASQVLSFPTSKMEIMST